MMLILQIQTIRLAEFFLDDAIVTLGVENTLFLAHADGTQASVKVLPKHKKLPTGVPYGKILAFKTKKENQVTVSDDDLFTT